MKITILQIIQLIKPHIEFIPISEKLIFLGPKTSLTFSFNIKVSVSNYFLDEKYFISTIKYKITQILMKLSARLNIAKYCIQIKSVTTQLNILS
jgi:hypothetical protein